MVSAAPLVASCSWDAARAEAQLLRTSQLSKSSDTLLFRPCCLDLPALILLLRLYRCVKAAAPSAHTSPSLC